MAALWMLMLLHTPVLCQNIRHEKNTTGKKSAGNHRQRAIWFYGCFNTFVSVAQTGVHRKRTELRPDKKVVSASTPRFGSVQYYGFKFTSSVIRICWGKSQLARGARAVIFTHPCSDNKDVINRCHVTPQCRTSFLVVYKCGSIVVRLHNPTYNPNHNPNHKSVSIHGLSFWVASSILATDCWTGRLVVRTQVGEKISCDSGLCVTITTIMWTFLFNLRSHIFCQKNVVQ